MQTMCLKEAFSGMGILKGLIFNLLFWASPSSCRRLVAMFRSSLFARPRFRSAPSSLAPLSLRHYCTALMQVQLSTQILNSKSASWKEM